MSFAAWITLFLIPKYMRIYKKELKKLKKRKDYV
jgi:hypothetical protein